MVACRLTEVLHETPDGRPEAGAPARANARLRGLRMGAWQLRGASGGDGRLRQ